MRRIQLVIAALLLCLARPRLRAGGMDGIHQRRGPVQHRRSPASRRSRRLTWPSEYGAVFPGRVYSVQQGGSKYSVTVIDYTERRGDSREASEGSVVRRSALLADGHPGVDSVRRHQAVSEQGGLEGDLRRVALHRSDLRPPAAAASTPTPPRPTCRSTCTRTGSTSSTRRCRPIRRRRASSSRTLASSSARTAAVRYDEIYSNHLPPITIRRNQPGAAGGNAPRPAVGRGGGGRGDGRPWRSPVALTTTSSSSISKTSVALGGMTPPDPADP